jgi:hypothetical protein
MSEAPSGLVAARRGVITFDRALDPAGEPSTLRLLLGLVCNEATVASTGPVGGNATTLRHQSSLRGHDSRRHQRMPFGLSAAEPVAVRP